MDNDAKCGRAFGKRERERERGKDESVGLASWSKRYRQAERHFQFEGTKEKF